MAEYIEREALVLKLSQGRVVTDDMYCIGLMTGIDHAIRTIFKQPIADVVEVKRGRWIKREWAEEENGFLISNFECSACRWWERKTSDFCPNCGADMREASE